MYCIAVKRNRLASNKRDVLIKTALIDQDNKREFLMVVRRCCKETASMIWHHGDPFEARHIIKLCSHRIKLGSHRIFFLFLFCMLYASKSSRLMVENWSTNGSISNSQIILNSFKFKCARQAQTIFPEEAERGDHTSDGIDIAQSAKKKAWRPKLMRCVSFRERAS